MRSNIYAILFMLFFIVTLQLLLYFYEAWVIDMNICLDKQDMELWGGYFLNIELLLFYIWMT